MDDALTGAGIEEKRIPRGALSGALDDSNSELYSCYSAVTSLSSLRLYCREARSARM